LRSFNALQRCTGSLTDTKVVKNRERDIIKRISLRR
jgi:hypothetical protein